MLFEGDGNFFLLVEVFSLIKVFFFLSELYILPEIGDRQHKDCLLVAGALTQFLFSSDFLVANCESSLC